MKFSVNSELTVKSKVSNKFNIGDRVFVETSFNKYVGRIISIDSNKLTINDECVRFNYSSKTFAEIEFNNIFIINHLPVESNSNYVKKFMNDNNIDYNEPFKIDGIFNTQYFIDSNHNLIAEINRFNIEGILLKLLIGEYCIDKD